jgi:predicted nucleic acid-binding protein
VIILDTNVISEGFRAKPHIAVQLWMDAQSHETLFICAPVLAEIRFGIARLEPGAQQDRLRAGADKLEADQYRGRILPFDAAAASIYGRLAAARERIGKPIGHMDGFIAAIAVANDAAIATRDSYGFSDFGLTIINPFEFKP